MYKFIHKRVLRFELIFPSLAQIMETAKKEFPGVSFNQLKIFTADNEISFFKAKQTEKQKAS